MSKIAPPPTNDRCDRFLLCQEALETAFINLAAAAADAGWERDEVAAALVELADNNVLSLRANKDLIWKLAAQNRQ